MREQIVNIHLTLYRSMSLPAIERVSVENKKLTDI